jgi:hypothetical protein
MRKPKNTHSGNRISGSYLPPFRFASLTIVASLVFATNPIPRKFPIPIPKYARPVMSGAQPYVEMNTGVSVVNNRNSKPNRKDM